MQLFCAGLTDTGMVRDHNEDNFYISEHEAFCVVADGMGGHLAGEVASRMAIEEIDRYYNETRNSDAVIELPFWPAHQPKPKSREERRLIASITGANELIHQEAAKRPDDCHGMGTTVVAAYFVEEGVFIAHAGDSRAYRFREGDLTQLSEDHSVANEYIRMGVIKPEDLETFPYRNVINKAVGLFPNLQIEVHFHDYKPGDIYLLCSDGLSDPLKSHMIRGILQDNKDDLAQACRVLVTEANRHGGPDNITVLLAQPREA